MSDCMPKAAEIAGEGVPSAPPLNDDQQELSKIVRALRHDPTLMGCFSLGRDGVMRSLTADRDVVDAVALSPRLIKAHLDRTPFDQKTEDEYRGVDGTSVPREQWFHPDKSLLPPPLSEKRKEETRIMMEEKREVISKAMERFMKGEFSGCAVVVRSNYNLETKNNDEEKQEETGVPVLP